MSPRTHWSWQERACPEVQKLTAALALREYVNNALQCAPDGHKVTEADWVREDLRGAEKKEVFKRRESLIRSYPGLLTGPHGVRVIEQYNGLPEFILSVTIPATVLDRQTEVAA
ncbi:hypothetical protein C8R46DRAFT_1123827 [Mycena filopes]|nr:hypothetical protein C8R46DRAFT_1123827 [Mycena filopes]